MTDANTITTIDQMADLPAGQWALTDDGKALCLYDTHMGFPQRMWGSKLDYGTKGAVYSFTSLEGAPLPLHLADVQADGCLHRRTNECGQCLFCGKPEIVPGQPLYLADDGDLFRAVAEHNSKIKAATA